MSARGAVRAGRSADPAVGPGSLRDGRELGQEWLTQRDRRQLLTAGHTAEVRKPRPHQAQPVLLPPEASGGLAWSPGGSFLNRAEAGPATPAAEPPPGQVLGLSPHDLIRSPPSRCQRAGGTEVTPLVFVASVSPGPQPWEGVCSQERGPEHHGGGAALTRGTALRSWLGAGGQAAPGSVGF